MTEILKTPLTLFLPEIDIEDEKLKRIFEQYNKVIEEFVIAVHSDITRFHTRIKTLEDA